MAVIKNGTPINANVTAPATGVQLVTTARKDPILEEQKKKKQVASEFAGQFGNNFNASSPYVKQLNNTPSPDTNNAYQVDQTIGGNNYYFQNGQGTTQGQQNSLVGTGAVAGIPERNLQGGLNYNQTQPVGEKTQEQAPVETTATPTGTPSFNGRNNGAKGTSVSTPNNPTSTNPEQEYSPDIVNGTGPIGVQKTEEQAVNTNDQALANMQNDLATQGGKIYGKFSESSGNPTDGINTLNDQYSVEQIVAQSRMTNLKALQTMNSEDIAESLASGFSPYGDQAMRDLMQYNPTKYAEVQQYLKEKQGQDAVDSIISKGTISTTSNTKTATNSVNNGITTWADGISNSPEESSQVTTNLMNTMASNQVANSATQEMLNINKDLAELQNKLDNVENEAKASFKGDVPQYIIDAKRNNLTQKYQAEISKLESRYNSALDLYKTELSNAQWQEEMKLKYLQFQQNVNNDNWTRYYQSQQLLQDSVKRVDGKAYKVDYTTGKFTQLTDQTAYNNYNQAVSSALQGYASVYTSASRTPTATGYKYNITGGQCETFTDNFTEATTGLRMTGANGRGWTYADEKVSYINSFVPEIGSVAVAVGGSYDSEYGHTMLVTGYNPDTGIVDLLWSNNGGDQQVYESHITLDKLYSTGLKGFWNPYLTAQSQSIASNGGYTEYGVTVTPMTAMFDAMIQSGKNQDTIAKAEQSYTYLYEIVNDGSLQQLIDSGDFGKIMAYMSKGNFGEKDDEGVKFSNRLKTYIEKRASKELTGGDESLKALNKLMQLVEVKLRKESGAAINSSEWLTNFEMFLPQPGESSAYQREKMKSWDSLILRNLRSAGLPSVSQYVPIFGTQARQIRAN